jgi:hypothetical protein
MGTYTRKSQKRSRLRDIKPIEKPQRLEGGKKNDKPTP